MKKVMTIMVMMFIAVGLVTMPAMGDTCTFGPPVGDTGTWENLINWPDCGHKPTAVDTAIIPDGKTCKIETADQAALGITVDVGGTLRVIEKVLQLWGNSTVNGTLSVESADPQPDPPVYGYLHCYVDMTIDGGGTITGLPGALYVILGFGCPVVTFESPLTVTGFLSIYLLELVNNATFLVDNPINEIYFDSLDISGTGLFEASAGVLELITPTFDGPTGPLTWKISGSGVMEITATCSACSDINGKFEISGGTVQVDSTLCTKNSIDFSGGKIVVADLVYAKFAGVCP